MRLVPAYWAVLFAAYAVNVVASHYGLINRPDVSPRAVLTDMFLLQDILPGYSPVTAAWILSAEIQFYFCFVLLLWAFQWLRSGFLVRWLG